MTQSTAERNANKRKHYRKNRARILLQQKKYLASNREKRNATAGAWRKRRRDLRSAAQKRYFARHPEKLTARNQRSYRRARQHLLSKSRRNTMGLSDSYVRGIFRQSGIADVPPQLIEAKRIHLKLQRLIREMEK